MAEAAEPAYMNPSSMYHGEINPGFMGDNLSIAGSRKSGALQPVMLMPHGPVPDERSATHKKTEIFSSDLYIFYIVQVLRVLDPHGSQQVPLQDPPGAAPPRPAQLPALGQT